MSAAVSGVPAEAIEAAARRIFAADHRGSYDRWGITSERIQNSYRAVAESALTAALPALREQIAAEVLGPVRELLDVNEWHELLTEHQMVLHVVYEPYASWVSCTGCEFKTIVPADDQHDDAYQFARHIVVLIEDDLHATLSSPGVEFYRLPPAPSLSVQGAAESLRERDAARASVTREVVEAAFNDPEAVRLANADADYELIVEAALRGAAPLIARAARAPVQGLADDLDREAKMLGGQPERTRNHIAARIRAALSASNSGAVEEGVEQEQKVVPDQWTYGALWLEGESDPIVAFWASVGEHARSRCGRARRLARVTRFEPRPVNSTMSAPVQATTGCDVCGAPSNHVTTPGGMRGCDDHFTGGRS